MRWLVAVSACWAWSEAAHAADIAGVWATDASRCNKVFSKSAKGVVFTKDADVHGGGFIIDGNTIIGRTARCRIKTRKEDGSMVHLLTSCANDIVLSDMQMSVKVLDPNRIARIFPSMGDMEIRYERCAL